VGAADSYAPAYLVGGIAALLGVLAAGFVAPRRLTEPVDLTEPAPGPALARAS
jgi:hypothetical protein